MQKYVKRFIVACVIISLIVCPSTVYAATETTESLTINNAYTYDNAMKYIDVVYHGNASSSSRDGDTYSISTYGMVHMVGITPAGTEVVIASSPKSPNNSTNQEWRYTFSDWDATTYPSYKIKGEYPTKSISYRDGEHYAHSTTGKCESITLTKGEPATKLVSDCTLYFDNPIHSGRYRNTNSGANQGGRLQRTNNVRNNGSFRPKICKHAYIHI